MLAVVLCTMDIRIHRRGHHGARRFQEWLGPGAPLAEEHQTRNSQILPIMIGQNVQNTASPTLMQSALKQIRFTVLHI